MSLSTIPEDSYAQVISDMASKENPVSAPYGRYTSADEVSTSPEDRLIDLLLEGNDDNGLEPAEFDFDFDFEMDLELPKANPHAATPGSAMDNTTMLFNKTLDIAVQKSQDYRDFINMKDRSILFDTLKQNITPWIWDVLTKGNALDKSTLHGLDEDLGDSIGSPGWHLAVGYDPTDITFCGEYVGQSSNPINTRISRHKSNARNLRQFLSTGNSPSSFTKSGGKTLFYLQWALIPSREFKFVCLGKLDCPFAKDSSQSHIWLNILEMFFCLAFQTLQRQTLEKYLDKKDLVPQRGLNLASPLSQMPRKGQPHPTSSSKGASPLRRYLRNLANIAKAHAANAASGYAAARANLAKANAANAAAGYASLAKAKKAYVAKKRKELTDRDDAIWRNGNPSDPTQVEIHCDKCKTRAMDSEPLFYITNGHYTSKRRRCPTCKKQTQYVPVDPGIEYVKFKNIQANLANLAKRAKRDGA